MTDPPHLPFVRPRPGRCHGVAPIGGCGAAPLLALLTTILTVVCLHRDSRAEGSSQNTGRTTVQGGSGARPIALPLRFEPNVGQFDARVRYLARGRGHSLYLTRSGIALSFRRSTHLRHPLDGSPSAPPTSGATTVGMRIMGGREVEPIAFDRLPGTSNYFLGSDRSNWRANVETYSQVRYRDVLPGVDVVYYGAEQRRIEYDIVLAAGVDPSKIAIAFDGIESLELSGGGDAILKLPEDEEVHQEPPLAYQLDNQSVRVPVQVRYRKLARNQLGFDVGPHDRRRPLVIDPVVLAYSTFLGGTGEEFGFGVGVDQAGNTYVAGRTASADFPTSAPLVGAAPSGATDAFVAKLDPSGSTLIYATYLGGTEADEARALAVDAAGCAYVAGWTYSPDFPTASPLSATIGGSFSSFVTKLDPSGSSLVYSTYFRAMGFDVVQGIAVDAHGSAYLAGTAASVRPAPNAFVAKLNPAGSARVYWKHFGGSGEDCAYAVAVDGTGSAYLAGTTRSSDFPTVSAARTTYGGGLDGFVTRVDPSGSDLIYSTYVGGTGDEAPSGIVVNAAGEAFVAGWTNSVDFPLMAPIQAKIAGGDDAFVTAVGPSGAVFTYSTYLGGTDGDYANGISLDRMGDIYVAGNTYSSNFPTEAALQLTNGGLSDGFVAKIKSTTRKLVFSTYLGGTGNDAARGIAVDYQNAHVVGDTTSRDFPTAFAVQSENRGADAFVVQIAGLIMSVPTVPWAHRTGLAMALAGFGLLLLRRRVFR